MSAHELTPACFEEAECTGFKEFMYPAPDDERAVDIARSICEDCVVINPCREYALAHKEKGGMWGGLLPDDRRGILRNISREKKRGRQ